MSQIDELVAQIQDSKKYREAGISAVTIRDILEIELANHKKPKDALKAARKKLHEVIAPYLGDPDYERAKADLTDRYAEGDEAAIRAELQNLMSIHHSTEERLDLLDEFYPRIFAITGEPRYLLDIACALNPLAFPWMGLPKLGFIAYDIHQQRVDFLNHFFSLAGIDGIAKNQDVLVEHPTERADVALLLKETARMEKRQRDTVAPMLDALQVKYIVLSLPAHSRTGRRDLSETYHELFKRLKGDRQWEVEEIAFHNELVFVIQK